MAGLAGGAAIFATAVLSVTGCDLAMAAGQVAPGEGQVVEDQVPVEWGQPVGGWSTALTSSRRESDAGTRVEVRLWVKNASREKREVEHCGFWPNHYLRVTDADGREVPATQRGDEARSAFMRPHRRKCFFVTLSPGAVDSKFEAYDLREYFVLPTGTIRVDCESWLGGRRLWSNQLTLTISDEQ